MCEDFSFHHSSGSQSYQLTDRMKRFPRARCPEPLDGVHGLLGIEGDFKRPKEKLIDYTLQPIQILM
jgi:hypothetical protein